MSPHIQRTQRRVWLCYSPEQQQRPDCPGLSMSDNSWSMDSLHYLDQWEIQVNTIQFPLDSKGKRSPFSPEQQQEPDCPGLSKHLKTMSMKPLIEFKGSCSPISRRVNTIQFPLDSKGRRSLFSYSPEQQQGPDCPDLSAPEKFLSKLCLHPVALRRISMNLKKGHSPSWKLDESGLPTNQEFTVGGGKTVEVTTTRLVSITVSFVASTNCITIQFCTLFNRFSQAEYMTS